DGRRAGFVGQDFGVGELRGIVHFLKRALSADAALALRSKLPGTVEQVVSARPLRTDEGPQRRERGSSRKLQAPRLSDTNSSPGAKSCRRPAVHRAFLWMFTGPLAVAG